MRKITVPLKDFPVQPLSMECCKDCKDKRGFPCSTNALNCEEFKIANLAFIKEKQEGKIIRESIISTLLSLTVIIAFFASAIWIWDWMEKKFTPLGAIYFILFATFLILLVDSMYKEIYRGLCRKSNFSRGRNVVRGPSR